MTEGDKTRIIAWSNELRAVHERLREALRATLTAARSGDSTTPAARDLLLFCHGFCAALTEHHEGEDHRIFPTVAATHPELAPTLRKLEQDHAMIAHLLVELEAATEKGVPPNALESHLEGIAAILESHFRYEGRELLSVLDPAS